jgi:isopenicillin-N epimerase
MAIDAQRLLSAALGTQPPVPEGMTACIAMVSLPEVDAPTWERLSKRPTRHNDALQDELIAHWGIQVPVTLPPTDGRQGPPLRCVRVSAQLYNSTEQYAYLARALPVELAAELGSERERPYTAAATL